MVSRDSDRDDRHYWLYKPLTACMMHLLAPENRMRKAEFRGGDMSNSDFIDCIVWLSCIQSLASKVLREASLVLVWSKILQSNFLLLPSPLPSHLFSTLGR